MRQLRARLDACRQVFEILKHTSERTYEAEIRRVQGLLLAQYKGGDAKAAEECFVNAMEVA